MNGKVTVLGITIEKDKIIPWIPPPKEDKKNKKKEVSNTTRTTSTVDSDKSDVSSWYGGWNLIRYDSYEKENVIEEIQFNNVNDVCDELKISKSTLYKYLKKGRNNKKSFVIEKLEN